MLSSHSTPMLFRNPVSTRTFKCLCLSGAVEQVPAHSRLTRCFPSTLDVHPRPGVCGVLERHGVHRTHRAAKLQSVSTS